MAFPFSPVSSTVNYNLAIAKIQIRCVYFPEFIVHVYNMTKTKTIYLSYSVTIKINNEEHPLYSFSATGDREREVRTAFLALLRLEAAFINIRAFARARVKPNSR